MRKKKPGRMSSQSPPRKHLPTRVMRTSQTSGTNSKAGTGTSRSSRPPGRIVIRRRAEVVIDRAVVVRVVHRVTETVVETGLAAVTKNDRAPNVMPQLPPPSRLRARGRHAAKRLHTAVSREMKRPAQSNGPRDVPNRLSSVRLVQHARRRPPCQTMDLPLAWMTNRSRVAVHQFRPVPLNPQSLRP